jgi:ureidoglycolate hydrolase
MSYPKDELAVPPIVAQDAKSFEIARVWVANGAQHVRLRADVWPDPAAWGIVLAELARHVALAYHLREDHAVEDVLERVLAGFQSELESPTEPQDRGIMNE